MSKVERGIGEGRTYLKLDRKSWVALAVRDRLVGVQAELLEAEQIAELEQAARTGRSRRDGLRRQLEPAVEHPRLVTDLEEVRAVGGEGVKVPLRVLSFLITGVEVVRTVLGLQSPSLSDGSSSRIVVSTRLRRRWCLARPPLPDCT